MTKKTYEVAPTEVNPREYWIEWLFLLASFATPIFVCVRYHDPGLFERSGSLMVFFAAVAEFVTINRLTKKHILNACRAKEGDTPQDVSAVAKIIGFASFILALIGTFIWGYGSMLYRT